MARAEYIKSARASKFDRTCYTCRQPIEVGQGYARNQPSRYSPTYQWHTACASPPASVLETNDKRSQAMAAFEDAYASLDAIGDDIEGDEVESALTDLRDTAAEGVREAAEMWREAQQSIEDGFGHATYQSDEMGDHADTYDGVADTIESIDIEPWHEDNDLDEYRTEQIENMRAGLGEAEGDLD
jgi:hypothetical protein